jgi:prepilin-type N-terminal cleavage/methylation domain-containing protein
MKREKGYTLIELMIVCALISIVSSIMVPKLGQLIDAAYQAKTKMGLGTLRSVLNIYYGDNEAYYPLQDYPEGDSHYTNDGLSLTSILVPRYISGIWTPILKDKQPGFNELSINFDVAADLFMKQSPPNDVFIVHSPQEYTPLLNAPYAYDNQKGIVFIPNGNYDTRGEFFYLW